MFLTMIDVVIVVLLIGMLLYAYMVNRRLRILMAALREMEPIVGAFSSAVDQSSRSVKDLKELSNAARRAEPPVQKAGRPLPEPEEETLQTLMSAEKRGAARLRVKNPVRGQTSVPGKSELVRTFFDITKERKG